MHIIVCIKQVPDTADVRINPETNTLMREGVHSIINPFDENALEAALAIKDHLGAEKVQITAISMGPPQAEQALRDALALGIDDVMLLSDRAFAGSDTLATSYTLAQAIKKIAVKPDLIICGKQAIDGDTAQVGPGIAEFLNLPLITYVRKIEIKENIALLERVFEDGFEKLEAALPIVITVLKEMNVPRMASLRGKMKAKKAEIKTLNSQSVGAESSMIGLKGSPTQVYKIFSPPKKVGGVILDGTHALDCARELIARLKEQKVI